MRRRIAGVMLTASILLLGISGYFLADLFLQERKDDVLWEQLKEIYENDDTEEAGETPMESEDNENGEPTSSAVHPGLLALHGENPDCIGWLRIDGTVIDYPVMYHPEEENYYLHRDFCGEYSANGCLFLSELCNPGMSDNLIIYGHQSVIFCGQFNTYLPFSLPAPAFSLNPTLPLYLLGTSRTILRYARAGDVFNTAHRTVFSG